MALVSGKNQTIGIDAVIPLEQDSTGLFYNLHKTVKTNIQQNLKMLLYTSPGERVMLPNYGVGLKRYLFEQSPDFYIDEKIREQIALYVPEVSIVSLTISRNSLVGIKTGASNNLSVELIYEINGYSIRDSLVLVDNLTDND